MEEEGKLTFSYEEMAKNLDDAQLYYEERAHNMVCAQQMPGTAFYKLSTVSGSEHYDTKKEEGWKFHISLGSKLNYQDNVSEGWEVVKDIAIKYNLGAIKVVRPGVRMKGDQVGKDVTIYTWVNPDKSPDDWSNIMKEICLTLNKQGVKPGSPAKSHTHKNEHKIDGNPYITYRYQHEAEVKIKVSASQSFDEPEDPYAGKLTNLDFEEPIKLDKLGNMPRWMSEAQKLPEDYRPDKGDANNEEDIKSTFPHKK